MNTRAMSIVPVRRAFTLVEMLVSLAVIVIVLAIVTNVFAIATQTTQTAQAITDVQTQLDGIVRELEADFRGIKTDRSVLLLYGRTQAAALTEADRQANKFYRFLTGDPTLAGGNFDPTRDPLPTNPNANDPAAQFSNPRADLMMFFTERPAQTATPVDTGANANAFQRSLAFGAKGSPVQVVYGHAAVAVAQPVFSGSDVTNYRLDQVRHIEQVRLNQSNQDRNQRSVLPLSEWTIARRALIVEPIGPATSNDVDETRRVPASHWNGGNDPLASVLVQARPMEDVQVPYADGSASSGRAADTIPFDMTSFLRLFDANRSYDGGTLRLIDRPAGFFGQPRNQTYWVSRVAQASPYRWREAAGSFNPAPSGSSANPDYSNASGTVDVRPLLDTVYPPSDVDNDGQNERAFRHFATAIKDPPASLRGNLNLQQLRACAWFQVEFLMPEDPRNGWDHPDGQSRSGMPRWVSVPDGEYYVFVPDSAENRAQIEANLTRRFNGTPPIPPAGRWVTPAVNSRLSTFGTIVPVPDGKDQAQSDRRVRTWPYAIRVTMRMFDSKGVLKDPITRTFEHWFD